MKPPASVDDILLLTIAHDLRNPLSILNHLVYLMEHHSDPRYVQQMKAQLNLCESVVNNVLALAGLVDSEKEPVQVGSLLENVVSLAAAPSTVRIVLPATTVAVWVNHRQILQALLNILKNAVEALGEGEGRIEMTATERTDSVCIHIIDSGPGFANSMLSSKPCPVISAKKDGLGIGLAAAARIIESNRGTLSLENRPPQGACCTVVLPKFSSR